LIFRPVELKFSVEGLLVKPLNNCEFRIYVCFNKHNVQMGVNERSDFLRPLSVTFCGCPQKVIWWLCV